MSPKRPARVNASPKDAKEPITGKRVGRASPKSQPPRRPARVPADQESPAAHAPPPQHPGTLRVLSWNVNGLRSVASKGFSSFLGGLCDSGPHILGVQETRATEADLEDSLRGPTGFHCHFVSAERKGYSGVALYSTLRPDSVETSLGQPEFDVEGRYQLARFGELWLVNAYFPNGSGKERDNSRIPYKLEFYRRVFERLEPARLAGQPILVMGDFNTAHQEIDLARPKENRKTSGFCEEERAEFDRWIRAGWVDTFRAFEPAGGHYSWWSQRFGVRAKNIGWRIDYVLASAAAMRFVRRGFLWTRVFGSDHCPVGIEIDQQVLGKLLQ